MSYSNGSGGTLTLPSPTHVHHVDVNAAVAAVRSLRRSISRSPSRFGLLRNSSSASSGSGDSTPTHTPQSHSPSSHQSPRRYHISAQNSNLNPGIQFHTPMVGQQSAANSSTPPQTTSFTPFRAGVKLSVRSARPRPLTARPTTRNRTSPRSPLKRVLGASSDSGNFASPQVSTTPEGPGQEDAVTLSSVKFQDFALGLSQTLSPASRRTLDRNLQKPSRHSVHLDTSGASNNQPQSISKFLDIKSDSFIAATASPLKRSDAIMDLDQPNKDSPVAKRRSLHGIASFGADFSIFDSPQAPTSQPSFEIHEDSMNQEYQLTGSGPSLFRDRDQVPPPTPTVPRRSSSLRKTTLQQRHGDTRISWGRRQGDKPQPQMGPQMGGEASTPVAPRNRPRLSLDQYLPPEPRGSPFTQGPLPNPSMHMFGGGQQQSHHHQPHPLSRTLTQSSSGSSFADDSPTHFPVPQISDRPRVPLNFSKSMPLGAQRPNIPAPNNNAELVATPAYKNAKPDQIAFASTGLISKVGRRAELEARAKFDSTPTPMPDTPCKKQTYPSQTFPPQSSMSGRRSSRPSFNGASSSPFGQSSNASIFNVSFGNSGNLFFKQPRKSLNRRPSLLSLEDSDDFHGNGDADFVPPTPTKNLFFKAPGNSQATTTPTGSPSTSRFFAAPTPAHANHAETQGSFTTIGSSPIEFVPASVSPSPKTPRDTLAPPDPSRLSISMHALSSTTGGASTMDRPPATPTTQGRQSLLGLGGRRFSITPGEHGIETDYDALKRRFDKVEPIGSGEFSHVFKVTESSHQSDASFSTTPSRRGTPSHLDQTNRVSVVKKISAPITGPKERKKRYHEVNVLKALSTCDHVVRFFDSWEDSFQLYIQTEYCEEGSLGEFLDNVGKTGRLDDFRLWKIMLELTQGLAEIHNSGFIHLDIKPANIFITLEGNLKIGDFGLAAEWPVQTSIDGEGDRVYIAPEILRGQYDKPADIFSLGLMMLEAAANVCLPDNGTTWRELREGDLSNVQTLTCSTAGTVVRDATGTPINLDTAISPPATECIPFQFSGKSATHDASNLFGAPKRFELQTAPDFMVNASHLSSLDNIVASMIHPDPAQRPTAEQLLEVEALCWVAMHRHAGATVFEGNWGPEEGPRRQFIQEPVDTEMTDV